MDRRFLTSPLVCAQGQPPGYVAGSRYRGRAAKRYVSVEYNGQTGSLNVPLVMPTVLSVFLSRGWAIMGLCDARRAPCAATSGLKRYYSVASARASESLISSDARSRQAERAWRSSLARLASNWP